MSGFLIVVVFLIIFGFLVMHAETDNENEKQELKESAPTDLLALMLQLTKASAQLQSVSQEVGGVAVQNKIRKIQELLDAERKRLVVRLRAAGVSELAIQQASSIE